MRLSVVRALGAQFCEGDISAWLQAILTEFLGKSQFKNENLSNSGGFNPTFRRESHIQPLLFSGSGYMTSLIKPIAPPHFRQYLAKYWCSRKVTTWKMKKICIDSGGICSPSSATVPHWLHTSSHSSKQLHCYTSGNFWPNAAAVGRSQLETKQKSVMRRGGGFAPPFPPLLFTGCIEVPIHQGNCTVNVGHFRSEFLCRRQATIEIMRGIYRMRGISPSRHCWSMTAEMLSIIKYFEILERILKMLGCHNWNNVKISSKSADVCLTHCVYSCFQYGGDGGHLEF